LKTRVISGIGIAIVLVIALLCRGYVLGGISLIVAEIGYYELTRALGVHNDRNNPGVLTIIGMIGVFMHYALLIYLKDIRTFLPVIMFVFFAVMTIYVVTFPKYKAHQAVGAVFSFIYAPVMLSFIILLSNSEYGQYYVFVPFVAWICDTFAYLTGRAFGRHKMAPVLSPHKTVEGGLGGILFSVVAGCIFGVVMSEFAGGSEKMIPAFMIITLVAGIISQIGDLAASAIKRDRGIKDYGSLIPGHGGIMDRFDSVIFVTPFIYILVDFILR
jgi:phosphatidate cytidylyltransferase